MADLDEEQRQDFEAQNPNKDVEDVKSSAWQFTDDGSQQYKVFTGRIKGENKYINGVMYENSEWPAYDRDGPRFADRERAEFAKYEQIEPPRDISSFTLDDFIDPKNPPEFSTFKPSEPEPNNGKIIDQYVTRSVERSDGSNIAFSIGRLSGTENYIRGFTWQGPDMEHIKPDKVWDNDTKYDTAEKALKAAPDYQREFQRTYEEDVEMAAEKGVADVIMEGIKNIKNPVRRAEAMKLAGKMAVQSAARKNENDRTTTNRQPRAQERQVENTRGRDRDIEIDR